MRSGTENGLMRGPATCHRALSSCEQEVLPSRGSSHLRNEESDSRCSDLAPGSIDEYCIRQCMTHHVVQVASSLHTGVSKASPYLMIPESHDPLSPDASTRPYSPTRRASRRTSLLSRLKINWVHPNTIYDVSCSFP